MSRRTPTRRGAALIIALVILAALLMLGLPFLFTQSSSLTGTRTFAQNQQAHLSDDAAENIGIDVVGTLMSFHYTYTAANPQLVEEYTSLYWSLRGGEYDLLPHFDPATQTGTAPLPPSPNHVHLDLRQLGLANGAGVLDPVHYPSFPDLIQPGQPPGNTPPLVGAVSTLGLAVEDEGGKLDPNYLDAISWMTLLQTEQISDTTAIPGQQGPGGLALALAQLHNPPNCTYPGLGRITYLEQLLSAVPAPNTRLGLTRTELETLRPLLSLSSRAMGRAGPRFPDVVPNTTTSYILSGPLMPGNPPAHAVAAEALTLIDLGTLLSVNGGNLQFDSLPPARMLGNAVTPALIGSGTTLVVEDKGATDANGNPLQIEHVFPNNQVSIASAAIAADMPAAIAAPPGINLLQAPPAIDQVLDGFAIANPPPPAPAPSSMAGANGLAMGAFSCTIPNIPGAAAATQANAFVLLNPLFTAVVLGTGTALPTTTTDVNLPTGAPTLAGPAQTYAAAADQNGQLRPELLAYAPVIHVQFTGVTALPPSGWAVLSGGLRADTTGIMANPEFVYYSALSIDNAASGLGTLSVYNGRGLTWANTLSQATAVFTDPNPKLSGVPPSPTLSITFFAPHELPTLQVSSHGVVTVESSATITDPSGRQVAQRSRRVTAQALPQESLLEERWLTQGQIHALLASRQGSLMTSFPRPYPRLSDVLPNDIDPAATAGYPDLDVGMRPATLRTLLTSGFVDHTWSLPLAGTSQTFLTASLNAAANSNQTATGVPGASSAGATNAHAISLGAAPQTVVTPEGLVCTAVNPAVYLAFPMQGADGGPFGINLPPLQPPAPRSNTEIPARQFGFWIKPRQPWTGIVPLLELRMPVANTGLPFSGMLLPSAVPAIDGRFAQGGTPPLGPDTSLQNYLALSYDGSVTGQEQLVLRFANGAIEHRWNYGPAVPAYDPTQTHLDTRSLGGSGQSLAPLRPFNDIECRYLYALEPDCWHLVQVSYLRDTPGAQAITVDGLAGRDITRTGTLTLSLPGDHLTLPSLVLGTALPAVPAPATVAAASATLASAAPPVEPGQLTVSCWVPGDPNQPGVTLGADSLLPASGYIRIGDEYLSYQSISPTMVTGGIATNTLNGVLRGQRQNTISQGSVMTSAAWPTMPAHNPGDLVVPGGYRIAGGGGSALLSGGCALAALNPTTSNGFWAGDSANGYLLWGTVNPSNMGDNVLGAPTSTTPMTDVVGTATYDVLYVAPYCLTMTPATPEAWPIRGFAKVVNISTPAGGTLTGAALAATLASANGYVFYYDNTAAGTAPGAGQPFIKMQTNIYPTTSPGGWSLAPSANGPWVDLTGGNSAFAVVMISCEIDSPAGTTLSAFSPGALANVTTVMGSYFSNVLLNQAAPPAPTAALTSLIQFYNQIGSGADSGDVEWMTYHWLTPAPIPAPTSTSTGSAVAFPYVFPSTAGQYFVVNFNGFPWSAWGTTGAPSNQRGMQRTHGPLDPGGNIEIYPAGTRVLPVQTVLSQGIGVVRTGDVVTIAPSVCQPGTSPTYTYGGSAGSPLTTTAGCWQAVVRYAPTDGFGLSSGATPSLTDDTNNNYFAFTEALPTAFAGGTFDLLCWPCWNANDLSPTAWNANPTNPSTPSLISGVASLMPWSNAFATGFLQPLTTDDRVTYIGATDDRSPQRNPNPVSIMEGEIDALHGGIPPILATQGVVALPILVAAIIAPAGTATPTTAPPFTVDPVSGNSIAAPAVSWLTATVTLNASNPVTIQASVPLIPTQTGYGLVQIGGEIFPYRLNVNATTGMVTQYLDLIGRGLLGSAPCAHAGPEAMVFLPIGPVWLLAGSLAQGYEGAVPLAPVPGVTPPPQLNLDGPAFLVSSLDGQNVELIAAPNGLTAPWLRGLYGSCPPEFSTTAGAPWNGALVIAWWPRYPSALPGAGTQQWTGLTPAQQSAMLRSRTYAWASFPLRFYDAWFSSTDDLGYVTLLDDAKVTYLQQLANYGNPTFDVFARALASGFDWVQTDNTTTPIPLPEIPFSASVAVSGSVQPAGTSIATAFASPQFAPQSTVANVDGAELRVLWRYHAPATTTAIDLVGQANLCNRAPTLGQAKLRCRAPAKIVGVESAR